MIGQLAERAPGQGTICIPLSFLAPSPFGNSEINGKNE
jgi:hypothetical protein